MAEMDEQTRKGLLEYQNLQQNLQFSAMQKQQLAIQLDEVQKALEELEKAGEGTEIYRAVGSVFVRKDRGSLKNELLEEKESIELRKGSLEKQEKKMAERFESLRKELEASMRKMEPENAPKAN